MKINLVVVAIFAIQNLCAQNAKEQPFSVNGHINGYSDEKIYLTYGTFGASKIDSTVVTNGKFSFAGKVSEPFPAMLFSKNYRVRLDLYVDKGNISITGNADSINNFRVNGSSTVNEFQAFNQEVLRNREVVIQKFQEEYNVRQSGDSVTADAIRKTADSLYAYEFTIRKSFIDKHPSSHISASELLAMSNAKNLEETKKTFASLSKEVQKSEKGKEVAERIALLSKTATGKQALMFAQNDVEDKKISLESYKGKYVLLEFWASWCGPCRAENPNLLKQYATYHPKGFEVLGVSLDNAKDKWVKAIEKDGLLWAQVSDLKGWNNEAAKLYGIKAIPANFLIDPAGKIVAQDLRGESLNKKLQEIFD